MKVICFVLFVFMRSTKLKCFKLCSWSLSKVLEEEGSINLVSWCLDLQVLEYGMIFPMKIKLNCN
jgi:hypothetical protein